MKVINEGFAHIGSIRTISSCKYNKSIHSCTTSSSKLFNFHLDLILTGARDSRIYLWDQRCSWANTSISLDGA